MRQQQSTNSYLGRIIAGISLTWFIVFVFVYSFVFSPPESLTPTLMSISRILFLGGVAMTQFVLSLSAQRLQGEGTRLPLAAVAFAFLACTLLIKLAAVLLSRDLAWPLLIGSGLAGCWSGIMQVLWSERVCSLGTRFQFRTFHVSTFIGALLFMALVYTLKAFTPLAVFAAGVAAFALYLSMHDVRPPAYGGERMISRKTSKALRKSTIALFIYGAVFGVGIYSCATTDAVGAYTSYATIGAALAAGSLVLVFLDYILNKRYHINEITLALAPMLALLLILMSFSNGLGSWAIYLVLIAVLTIFDNTAFCFQLDAVHELKLNPFAVISRVRMSVQMGMFVASLANFLFISLGAQPAGWPLVVPLTLVVFLFVMMASMGDIEFIPKQLVEQAEPAKPVATGTAGSPVTATSNVIEQIVKDYDLSPREADVFELIIAGNSTPAIAEKLYIAPNTVKSHRYNIFRKMSVESKQQIIEIRDRYLAQQ